MTTAHRVHIIKCTSSAFWEIRDVQGFCHSVPLARRQSPHTLNRRSAYAYDAGSEIRFNGDLGQKWISSLASLPELDSTAIQNCTRAYFSSIVGKFSLLDQHQQMLTGYENWTVAASGTWTASKACVFQARSWPIAAVPHSGNCCQRYYRFLFGFFRFRFISFFIFSF